MLLVRVDGFMLIKLGHASSIYLQNFLIIKLGFRQFNTSKTNGKSAQRAWGINQTDAVSGLMWKTVTEFMS